MSGRPTLKLTAKEGKCLRSHTEHINDKMQKRGPLVAHLPLRLFGRAQKCKECFIPEEHHTRNEQAF